MKQETHRCRYREDPAQSATKCVQAYDWEGSCSAASSTPATVLNRFFVIVQDINNSGLVLNRIHPFHLLAMRSPSLRLGTPHACMMSKAAPERCKTRGPSRLLRICLQDR